MCGDARGVVSGSDAGEQAVVFLFSLGTVKGSVNATALDDFIQVDAAAADKAEGRRAAE